MSLTFVRCNCVWALNGPGGRSKNVSERPHRVSLIVAAYWASSDEKIMVVFSLMIMSCAATPMLTCVITQFFIV